MLGRILSCVWDFFSICLNIALLSRMDFFFSLVCIDKAVFINIMCFSDICGSEKDIQYGLPLIYVLYQFLMIPLQIFLPFYSPWLNSLLKESFQNFICTFSDNLIGIMAKAKMCSQCFKIKVFQIVYNVGQRLHSLLKCGATKILVLLLILW